MMDLMRQPRTKEEVRECIREWLTLLAGAVSDNVSDERCDDVKRVLEAVGSNGEALITLLIMFAGSCDWPKLVEVVLTRTTSMPS